MIPGSCLDSTLLRQKSALFQMSLEFNITTGTAIKYDHETTTDNSRSTSTNIMDSGCPTVICASQIAWRGLVPGVKNSKNPLQQPG